MADASKIGAMFGDSSSNALATANNYLGLNLYNLLSQNSGNMFFSPLSMSIAFAMLYRGAQGTTFEEMEQVLGYKHAKLTEKSVHEEFRQMLDDLKGNAENILSIANALLMHKSFPFHDEYKNDATTIYQASIRDVDFGNTSEIIGEINEWVAATTNGKITNLVNSLDSETVMIILSAIYFKGMWAEKFNAKHTSLKPFFNRGLEAQSRDVPMMYIKTKFPYYRSDTFQALELPYKGSHIAMIVILPLQRGGLKEVERAICSSAEIIRKENFRKLEVRLTIPKLHLECSSDLKDIFIKLGMPSAFTDRVANFSKLTDAPVVVSEVIHKAVLDVNEEGTEAAAVTKIAINARCMPIEREFVANHPFLFVIIDKIRDLILFMGRVEEI